MDQSQIEKLVRKNIRELSPYVCARHNTAKGILMDANENPYGDVNRYPDPLCVEVKKALGFKDDIFVGNGSDEAIDLVFRIFCEPGKDEVIINPPTYGMYKVCAAINNIKVKNVPLNKNFQIDLPKLFKAITPKTKLIFFCTPNNPTGNCLKDEDILKVCKKFNGIVVVDEAYIEFAEKKSLVSEIKNFNNLVVIRTLSKAFGAAGIRLGYAVASPYIIGILNNVKFPYNVNILTQKKAVEILNKGLNIGKILEERKRLSCELKNLGLKVYPSDSNFILFRINEPAKMQKILQDKGIIIRQLSSIEECLRVSIGTKMQNNKFLKNLTASL